MKLKTISTLTLFILLFVGCQTEKVLLKDIKSNELAERFEVLATELETDYPYTSAILFAIGAGLQMSKKEEEIHEMIIYMRPYIEDRLIRLKRELALMKGEKKLL